VKTVTRSRTLSLAGVAALLLAVAVPSTAAGPIYSWRTEDGGYAFTDDPKAIPARYRDQAKVRSSARLADYPRYTPSDDKAVERYAERLGQRLAHLRALNAQPVPVRRSQTLAASGSGPAASLTLDSANEYAPSVEISEATGEEPIVVDTLFTRPEGKMVTRHSQVVRQGDKILSVMRPRLREWSVVDDIHDEADLMD
jgi:hypothetical protein